MFFIVFIKHAGMVELTGDQGHCKYEIFNVKTTNKNLNNLWHIKMYTLFKDSAE